MTPKEIWTPSREIVPLPEGFSIPGVPIEDIGDYSEGSGCCMTIYGWGGGGKTTLAGTVLESRFVRPGRVWYGDAEANAHVIQHLAGQIKFTRIKALPVVERFTQYAQTHKNEFPFDAVIWDNLAELQNIFIDDAAGGPGAIRQIQHYNTATQKLQKFVRDWRVMAAERQLVVIFIGWEDAYTDTDTNQRHSHIQMTPAMQKAYPGMVGFMGLLTAEGPKLRKLDMTANKNRDTKLNASLVGNSSKIPLVLWNPSLGPVIDTIIGGDSFPTARFAMSEAAKGALTPGNAASNSGGVAAPSGKEGTPA